MKSKLTVEDRENIINYYNREKKVYLMDGLNDALIASEYTYSKPCRAIYDVDKCINIIMKKGKLNYQDAWDYFEYNVVRAINYLDPEIAPILIQKMKVDDLLHISKE